MSGPTRRGPGARGDVARIMSHSFLPRLVPTDGVVVDLGANRGAFSTEIHERFGWRCVAVEPNPEMFRQIPERDGIIRINAAVTDHDGPVILNVADNPEGSSLLELPAESTASRLTVPGMTLSTLRETAGVDRIDLLKMDIEGAEIELLRRVPDQLWTEIRQITIEFHESTGLSTVDEVRKAIGRLERLGFTSVKMSLTHYGDVLFVNQWLCGASSAELAMLKWFTRNLIWAKRAWHHATARWFAGANSA